MTTDFIELIELIGHIRHISSGKINMAWVHFNKKRGVYEYTIINHEFGGNEIGGASQWDLHQKCTLNFWIAGMSLMSGAEAVPGDYWRWLRWHYLSLLCWR
jgi:hypothetical protein